MRQTPAPLSLYLSALNAIGKPCCACAASCHLEAPPFLHLQHRLNGLGHILSRGRQRGASRRVSAGFQFFFFVTSCFIRFAFCSQLCRKIRVSMARQKSSESLFRGERRVHFADAPQPPRETALSSRRSYLKAVLEHGGAPFVSCSLHIAYPTSLDI